MTDFKSPVPDPAPGARAPAISRAIYGMPMFATLLARDIRASVSWYTAGLGFIELFTIPGPHGGPVLAHLRRWQFQDLLLRPAREPAAVPGSGCTLSFAAVYDEINVLAERARAHGGGQVNGPADTSWNTRDLTTTDPDGNIVIFTAARPPELADAAFSGQMHQWSSQQGLRANSPATDPEHPAPQTEGTVTGSRRPDSVRAGRDSGTAAGGRS